MKSLKRMQNGASVVKKEVKKEKDGNTVHTDDYNALVKYGISEDVAAELEKIYATGKLSHSELDERALDALKEFNADDAIKVLEQFNEASLEHVTNKSAFLCGQMKTYRQKSKGGPGNATPKGPDPEKIKEILDRSGYTLDVTTGQRKYGGPPPDWGDDPQPGPGHEVFIGKIPKDVFEDELIPLVEECGRVWDLRLMMDPLTGFSRGYAFCTYVDKDDAKRCVQKLEGYEIKKGKTLKANVSIANQRLFVGNIPKSKSEDEIKEEFSKRTEGLEKVIIYRSVEKENQKNRGFAFLDYDSHKSASTAKRKLASGRVKVWNCDIIVDWADPVEEPDDETMSKVKVLYVKNLTTDVTEEQLKEAFEKYGTVERVKKIKDYGFVHFEDRDKAVEACNAMNGQTLGKLSIEVSLAKPPNDNKKKDRRMQGIKMRGPGFEEFYPPVRMGPPPPLMGRGGFGRRAPPPPPDYYFDEYYDYYGGGDEYFGGGYGPPMRGGRGGRGGPFIPPPVRGRGGVPPRGGPRGGPPVAARGMRGAARGRGGPMMRGRGGPMAGRGQQTPRGAKRKAPEAVSNMGAQAKRRPTSNEWGAQPIAQQPLGQSGYGGYGGEGDAQWYQDSYGQNWG